MANIILRRACCRAGRNFRFYCNLSKRATQSNRSILTLYKDSVSTALLYERNRLVHPAPSVFCKYFSEKKNEKDEPRQKLSLFQKFKQMYRDYWYVLMPVHVITSIGWFGGFYYLAKSGVDIIAILEAWHVSDVIINPLRDSSMGYVAVSYALYKIFTPLRYTVTLGGTTVSINYLKKWGYIKPVPSAKELKSMYAERRDNIIESVKEKTTDFRLKTEHLKDKRDELMEDIEKGIKVKIKDAKDQITEKKKNLFDDINNKPLKVKSKE